MVTTINYNRLAESKERHTGHAQAGSNSEAQLHGRHEWINCEGTNDTPHDILVASMELPGRQQDMDSGMTIDEARPIMVAITWLTEPFVQVSLRIQRPQPSSNIYRLQSVMMAGWARCFIGDFRRHFISLLEVDPGKVLIGVRCRHPSFWNLRCGPSSGEHQFSGLKGFWIQKSCPSMLHPEVQ